jgi:hypothetical protein
MAMSTMKDSERIELLKEIGGTKVYEERCAESLKVMKDAEARRAQIEDVVSGPQGQEVRACVQLWLVDGRAALARGAAGLGAPCSCSVACEHNTPCCAAAVPDVSHQLCS